MAIVIGITFPFPTQFTTDVRVWPLGVDFVGVDDDGVDVQLFYFQQDQSEPLTKQRIIEFVPPVFPFSDDGRTFIGSLTGGWTVWENTETTIPDRQRRETG